MFSHVDTDGNGKVDFEEFLRMVKCKEELRGRGRAEEPNTRREDGQNVRRAEEADTRRAEEANLGREDEASLGREDEAKLEREDEASTRMFRMFDKDQSGSLSRQEWEAVRSREIFT